MSAALSSSARTVWEPLAGAASAIKTMAESHGGPVSDQTLDVTFSVGPDDQSDPRLSPPGQVVSAFNQVYDLDGSYQPRFGYTALADNMTQVRRLAVFADELLAVDGSKLYSYDPTGQIAAPKDVVPAPGVTHRPLFNTSTSFSSWNEAVGNGYRVVAWIDGVDSTPLIRAAVYSIETGAMVFGPVQVSTSARQTTSVQVAVVGTTALVTWIDVIAPAVAGSKLDLTNIAAGFGAPTTLSDAGNPLVDGTYQYTLCSTASLFIITYETNPTGGTHNGKFVSRSFVAPSLALQSSVVNATGIHRYQSISIASVANDGGDLWVLVSAVGYITDSAAGIQSVWSYRCSPSTLVASTSAIDMGSGTELGIAKTGIDLAGHSGTAVAVWSGTNGMFYNWVSVAGPGPLVTALHIFNIGQSSSPVYDSVLDCTYVYCNTPSLYAGALGVVWGSYYLVNLGTLSAPLQDLQAILAPRVVNLPSIGNGSTWLHVPRAFFAIPAGNETSNFEVALPVVDNRGRQGMELFVADLHASFRWSPASLGREHYLSGSIYDGNLLSEIGFASNPFVTQVTAGGVGLFTGTWEYVVTFGRINAQGDLEESAPSLPVRVTANNNATFTVNTISLTLSQKWRTAYGTASGTKSPVFIIVYRSQELSSGNTLHYRVYNEPFPLDLVNVQTAAFTVITDTTTDASLTDGTHPILYTDSGELPHNSPETFTHITSHKNRIVGIGADQRTVWISQEYVEGTTPAFNELVTFSVDDTAEPLTAVASLYDKLLIFTSTRIYIVYGDGPAISGAGNDYTNPQRIPSPSGCLDPRSLCNTPLGIVFQGIMGLMLADTGLGVTFMGKQIVGALAPYPACVAASWCEDSSTIRFAMTSDDAEDARAATGVIACYDVRRQRWAVHQMTNAQIGGSVLPGGSPMAAAAWHPILGYVTGVNTQIAALGGIYRESTLSDAAPWLDYGTYFVPLIVTTTPIKSSPTGGPQGGGRFRRLRVLGQFYESHGLTVTLGLDYAEPSEAHVYSSAQVLAFVSGDREQVRCIPQYGKGEALQVTLQTTEPSPHPSVYTGRACGFTGYSLEIHQRQGGYRNIGAGAKT